MTQYSSYLMYRIPDSGFLIGINSYLQGELEEVVWVNDYASFYDTLDGDGIIGSVIGYGGIYPAA